MSNSVFPSQTQDKFALRLPDGMRDRIKAAAEANNRSMNAEIVSALYEKYPPETAPEFEELFERAMKVNPDAVRRVLQALLNAEIGSGRITEADIEAGLIPGVRLREVPESPPIKSEGTTLDKR